jgi:hypothetical protein
MRQASDASAASELMRAMRTNRDQTVRSVDDRSSALALERPERVLLNAILRHWGAEVTNSRRHNRALSGCRDEIQGISAQSRCYDRATFDRIRLALNSASPPSLSVIAKAERLSKQTIFRLKQDPQAALAALDAWGL